MAKKNNGVVGAIFLAGIAFVIGKYNGDDDAKTTQTSPPAAQIAAAKADEDKPIMQYVPPKPLPYAEINTNEDWQNVVNQANNQAVKNGLAVNKQYRHSKKTPRQRSYAATARSPEEIRQQIREWHNSYDTAPPNTLAGTSRFSSDSLRYNKRYAPSDDYSSGVGTVNVRGYYRKDGTYVQPHTRRKR